MTEYVLLLKSGAGKGSKVFYFEDSKISFPYIDPEDAWKQLGEFFEHSWLHFKSSKQTSEKLLSSGGRDSKPRAYVRFV